MLAGKGSLRRANRALACCAPFRPEPLLRWAAPAESQGHPLLRRKNKTPGLHGVLDRVAPYQFFFRCVVVRRRNSQWELARQACVRQPDVGHVGAGYYAADAHRPASSRVRTPRWPALSEVSRRGQHEAGFILVHGAFAIGIELGPASEIGRGANASSRARSAVTVTRWDIGLLIIRQPFLAENRGSIRRGRGEMI